MEIYPTSEWELFIYKLKADKWCIGEPLRSLSMPDGTRIAAVFRNKALLHPSGSTRLEEDDTLCVLAQEKDLDALSLLFSEAPEKASLARFFGDFFLDIEVNLADIAMMYGLNLGDESLDKSLRNLVEEQLGTTPVLGDQFEWQGLQWIIADVVDQQVTKVGIRLPSEQSLLADEE